MTTLGFLGVGSMGRGMAARLVEAGHDVIVWNRSSDAVDSLVALGARAAAQPGEALAPPISFSMLANDDAVIEVLSPDALRGEGGRTHVMMASISSSLADRLVIELDAAGLSFVAAPVLGRPDVAAAGKLNILAGGARTDVERVRPYLEILGERIWPISELPSVANAVKVAVNYNIIHALQAIGESVAMTERMGVDARLFTELLSSTLFGGVVYTGYGRLIAERNYWPPGFHIALGRKDLLLAEEVAAANGIAPATMPALIHAFDRAMADPELREGDWSAIAEVTRRESL